MAVPYGTSGLLGGTGYGGNTYLGTAQGLGAAGGTYDAAIQGLPSYMSAGATAPAQSLSVPRPVGLNGTSGKLFAGQTSATAMDGVNGYHETHAQDSKTLGFDALDKNGDGVVTRDEFEQAMRQSNFQQAPREPAMGLDFGRDGRPDLMLAPDRNGEQVNGYGGHGPTYFASASNSYADVNGAAPIRRERLMEPQPDYNRFPREQNHRVRAPGHYVEVSEAPRDAQYVFPTAGSFIAEPFREGSPMYMPSQRSYPSSCRERSSSPMPCGSRSPMYGGAYHSTSSPYYPSEGYLDPRGRHSVHHPHNSYSYSRSVSPMYRGGDTYSGGAVSYGPAPGAAMSYSPAPCGQFGAASMPLPTSNMPYSFRSSGSFVAEPFAPGAPPPSALLPRSPSYGPPAGPCLGGFQDSDGYGSTQFSGLPPLGGPMSFGGGGASSPFLPPPQASFLAGIGPAGGFPEANSFAPPGAFGQCPGPLSLGRSSFGGPNLQGLQGPGLPSGGLGLGLGLGSPLGPPGTGPGPNPGTGAAPQEPEKRSVTPQPPPKRTESGTMPGRTPGSGSRTPAPRPKKREGRAGCC